MNDFYILKLLLQPLVENALYHGIKYKRGGGTIRVAGRMEDGRLIFTVSDTGKGMDAETLSALRARMAPISSAWSGEPGMSAPSPRSKMNSVSVPVRSSR